MSEPQLLSPVAAEQAFALWRIQRRGERWFVSSIQPDNVIAWQLEQVKFGTLAMIVGHLEKGGTW